MARWRTKTGGMAELGERDNIGRVHQHSKVRLRVTRSDCGRFR